MSSLLAFAQSVAVALALAPAQGIADHELSAREFDVRRLLALEGAAEIAFDLAPPPIDLEGRRPDREPETWRAVGGDELAERLEALCVADDEPADLRCSDTGTLRVVASSAVHARVERALAAIESALLGFERLEVRVVAGVGVRDAPAQEATGDADRRIDQLVASGKGRVLRRGSVALEDLFTSSLRDVSSRRYVRDYEVEIAHGSFVHDPITAELETGLVLDVRAARVPDGTRVDLAFRHAEVATASRRLIVRPKAWGASDWPHELEDADPASVDHRRVAPAIHSEQVPLAIEIPATRDFGFAGSFVVPRGRSLWLPCRIEARSVAGPAESIALELRVVGAARPQYQALEGVTPDGSAAALLHVGALQGLGIEGTPADDSTFALDVGATPSDAAWPTLVGAEQAFQLATPALDRVRRALGAAEDADDGRFLELLTGELLLARGPAESCRRIGEVAASEAAASLPIEWSGRLLRGSETVAQFRVPGSTGRPAHVAAGIASAALVDWDVDVANEALISNPEVRPAFDGLVLQCVVHPLHGGRAQLVVDGLANLFDAPPPLEPLGSPFTPEIEKLRATRSAWNEARNVPLVDGCATARFGGQPIALELTARFLAMPTLRDDAFDVRPLVATTSEVGAALDLCPPPDPVLAAHEPLEIERRPAISRPALVEVAAAVVASIVAAGGGEGSVADALHELRVDAPEPARRALDRALALIESACLGEERLDVRLLVGAGLGEVPVLLDVDEADRRVAQLVEAQQARIDRAGTAALEGGRSTSIRAHEAAIGCADWEVEIAHGAAIHDPVVRPRVTGLTMRARAARREGATRLDLAASFLGDGPPRELTVRPRVRLSTPLPPAADPAAAPGAAPSGPSVFDEEVPLRIEASNEIALGVATTLLLPDGRAAWIPAQIATAEGTTSCALVVALRGPRRPLVATLASGEVEDAVVDVAAIGASGFEGERFDASTIANAAVSERDREPWWPSIVTAGAREIDVAALARTALDRLGASDDSFVLPLSDRHLFVRAPAAIRDELVRAIEREAPRLDPIVIGGRVTRGSRVIGTFTLPATAGEFATVWSGTLGTFLADWDVDVAGEAMIGNPEVGLFLDGYALRIVALADDAGRLDLTVRGVVNSLDAPPSPEPIANPFTPLLEQLASRRLVLDETRRVDPKDGAAVRFENDELGVEITVITGAPVTK